MAGGFTAERIQAGSFTLQAFHKGLTTDAEGWHVYLEGDGLAFRGRHKLSADPTPIDPVALDLALIDPAPAVLYLGRPCQYRAQDDRWPCPSRYWSSHRFAEEVVTATASAIESLLANRAGPAAGVTLIGYSGGGTLATLIAARSPRIDRLVTIAAPLDLAAWTRHHDVSSLDGSIDPTTVAHRLSMPQTHMRGRLDRIAPPALQTAFLERLSPSADRRLVTLDDVDHSCCWQRLWPDLSASLSYDRR